MYTKKSMWMLSAVLHIGPGHNIWVELPNALRCCTIIGQFRDWAHLLGGSTGGTASVNLAQTVSRKRKVWKWSTEIGVCSLMGPVPWFPLARQTAVSMCEAHKRVFQAPCCTKYRSVPHGGPALPLQKWLYGKRAGKLLFCLETFAGRIPHRENFHGFIKVRKNIEQTAEVSPQYLWGDFTIIHFPKVAFCIWALWIYSHL